MARPLASLLCTVWGAAAVLLGACGPPPCPDCLVLEGVTVIDGLGTPPQPHRTLVVRGGLIEGLHDERTFVSPPGAEVRRLPGRFVLPGFVDTHAHVTILPLGPDGQLADRMDRGASEAVLRGLVAFGVTSARNPAAPLPDGVELRDAVSTGGLLGPTLRTAGPAIHARRADGTPHDPASVRAEVRTQAAAGVDLVKVYASVSPGLLAAVVDEAHRQGIEVVGHLQRTTWAEAARLGIDHVTHGAPWSAAYLPDSLRVAYRAPGGSLRRRLDWLAGVDLDGPQVVASVEALAAAGVTLDPTLIAYHTKHWGDDPRYLANADSVFAPRVAREVWRQGTFVDDWGPEDFARAKALWPVVLGLTRRLYEGGVTLTVGTDLPNPWVVPGVSFHDELRLLHDAGIPALAVLQMATFNGATALGLADQTGSVEVGKEADLVVLTADPVADLANTRAIEWVVLDGRLLSPEALRR